MGDEAASVGGRRSLEQAIVDTVREPLVVLDTALRVVAASRSFYLKFDVGRQDTEGRMIYELGNGQWNIPRLRRLLEDILPQHTTMEAYEVHHEFPSLGPRTMMLNARRVFYEGNGATAVLLAIEDVTEQRALERENDELLRQKDLLLREMNHRVNNSLALPASSCSRQRRSSRRRRVSTSGKRMSGCWQSRPCRNNCTRRPTESRSRRGRT